MRTKSGRKIAYHSTTWLNPDEDVSGEHFYRFTDTDEPAGSVVVNPSGRVYVAVADGPFYSTGGHSESSAVGVLAGLL